MAQACMVMRPQHEQLFTPGKAPAGAELDTSLITSAVRKRKVEPVEVPFQKAGDVEDVKRLRTPQGDGCIPAPGCSDAVVHLSVGLDKSCDVEAATPACSPLPSVASPEVGPWADEQQQQAAEGGDVALFSPLFLLHKESTSSGELSAVSAAEAVQLGGAVPARAPAPQGLTSPMATLAQLQQAEGENQDTDHSTGTSASLPDADLGTDVASPSGGCLALASRPTAVSAAAAAPEDEDEYLEFDPLAFIKRLPPLERCVPPGRDFLLPRKTRRSKLKTLVLDLDETLVHSTLDGYCRPDFTFPVEVGSITHLVGVRKRPHLHTFLDRVAQLFEVVVFTASQRVYAEQLLNIVDPTRTLVRHRVYRESCVFWEGNYLKDLTVLGRDLAHTMIVDNSPQAFGFQLDNGIPIESWYDDDADEELLKLIPFLERVAHVDDVRPHIQKRYRLRNLVEAAAAPDRLQL